MIDIKLKNFKEVEKERLEGMVVGELVWEAVPRDDYSVSYNVIAIKSINAEEGNINGIDINNRYSERKYDSKFIYTASELLDEKRLSREDIAREYKKHKKIISKLKG